MNVTLTNSIIFTTVQFTILIVESNVPAVVMPQNPNSNPADQALAYIGFGTEGNRNNIRDEVGLEAFNNFVSLTMRNICDMESGFSKRTTAQGRINFGMWRVKYTLGIMHWEQDESCWSCTASITGITDAT